MDPDYPTTEIKEETDKNDEADASANAIKLEPPDPDVDYDSIKFEESKLKNWVESFASMSKTEFMEQEASKDGSQSAPHGDKLNIKLETDIGDHAGCDLLNRIKDEHNTEQWDELDQIADVAEQVKMEDLAAIGVKLEDKIELETQQDSTKTEDMDTTELTEELDIKPDETSDAEVDSERMRKYCEKGLGVVPSRAERELFICYVCNSTFQSKKGLVKHLRVENCYLDANVNKSTTHKKSHPSNVYVCTQCNKLFFKKTSLDIHVVKIHGEISLSVHRKLHKCLKCDCKFKNKGSLTRHMSVHTDTASSSKLSECIHCDKTFTSKQTRDDHVLKRHPNFIASVTCKIHECSKCEYKTTMKRMLDDHYMKVHLDVDSCLFDTCQHCNKTFRKGRSLDSHIIKKHPNFIGSVTRDIHHCPTCTYKTVNKYCLDKHLLVHTDSTSNCDPKTCCVHCNSTFKTKQKRDEHILIRHPDFSASVTSKIHECSKCTYKTTEKNKLDGHTFAVHSGSADLVSTCIHCSASFKQSKTLDDHIMRKHPNFIASVKRQIYQCPHCTYKTVRRNSLTNHLFVHPGAVPDYKPSTCIHCDATFKNKQRRDDHIMREHPDFVESVTSKIHKCPNCTYVTTKKSRLQKHMSQHSGR